MIRAYIAGWVDGARFFAVGCRGLGNMMGGIRVLDFQQKSKM